MNDVVWWSVDNLKVTEIRGGLVAGDRTHRQQEGERERERERETETETETQIDKKTKRQRERQRDKICTKIKVTEKVCDRNFYYGFKCYHR